MTDTPLTTASAAGTGANFTRLFERVALILVWLLLIAGFGAAMEAVGWLEDDGESLCTPRFDEHNGQSAKRRATEAERKREVRKMSAPDADNSCRCRRPFGGFAI
jgi:hypothetical protein